MCVCCQNTSKQSTSLHIANAHNIPKQQTTNSNATLRRSALTRRSSRALACGAEGCSSFVTRCALSVALCSLFSVPTPFFSTHLARPTVSVCLAPEPSVPGAVAGCGPCSRVFVPSFFSFSVHLSVGSLARSRSLRSQLSPFVRSSLSTFVIPFVLPSSSLLHLQTLRHSAFHCHSFHPFVRLRFVLSNPCVAPASPHSRSDRSPSHSPEVRRTLRRMRGAAAVYARRPSVRWPLQ